MLEQSANEEILADSLKEAGHEVLWNHGFDSLQETGERVEVRCTGPEGPLAISARYVIAADGASSEVREATGHPL